MLHSAISALWIRPFSTAVCLLNVGDIEDADGFAKVTRPLDSIFACPGLTQKLQVSK